MACPQKENGYTPIANELLEAFLLYRFPKNTGDTPILIWMFIARKTYGFSKKEDIISLTQFEKGIGTRRGTIVHWLNYLVQARVLVRASVPDKNGFLYAINKNYDTWLPLVQARRLVQARNISSTLASTKTSTLASTHINKKQYNINKHIFFENPDFVQRWGDYLEMRKKIKKPATDRAQQLVLQKLEKFNVETACRMLDQSVLNSWQGIFPLKDEIITTLNPLEQEASQLVKQYGHDLAQFKFLEKHSEADLLKVKHIINL